ncbi:MAG: flavodoxin family protein [Lachnospiraceae bacterium]|nr:flavodoxin family protein [Lachnospiraceae bacterium]
MQNPDSPDPTIERMIENFDQALTHPDMQDLFRLKEAVKTY